MKCPRCQHENPPGSNFCLGCGTRLGATCSACGSDLPAGSRFCNKCGAPVRNESAGETRFASPQSYTPKHLAERILTEIASSGEPAEREKAQEQYRQAITLAEEMGMRPLIAHCRAGLAKLNRRMGKRAESDKHFAVATSMYCEMGMPFWLEKAKVEMAQLR